MLILKVAESAWRVKKSVENKAGRCRLTHTIGRSNSGTYLTGSEDYRGFSLKRWLGSGKGPVLGLIRESPAGTNWPGMRA
jgi:hypothetical protein